MVLLSRLALRGRVSQRFNKFNKSSPTPPTPKQEPSERIHSTAALGQPYVERSICQNTGITASFLRYFYVTAYLCASHAEPERQHKRTQGEDAHGPEGEELGNARC